MTAVVHGTYNYIILTSPCKSMEKGIQILKCPFLSYILNPLLWTRFNFRAWYFFIDFLVPLFGGAQISVTDYMYIMAQH